MAITSTQQGVITEAEFAKVCILTSNGRLVPTRALADDDRRDFEIHIRRHFGESLAVQLKTAKHLRLHGRAQVLQINFREKGPLINDPRLVYFLAHFDIVTRGFIDPVILVPSVLFHRHALHGFGHGATQLQFKASMEPNAKDMWAQWALPQDDLGRRMLQMLNAQLGHSSLDPKVEQLIAMRGTVWLRQPSSIVAPMRHRAA